MEYKTIVVNCNSCGSEKINKKNVSITNNFLELKCEKCEKFICDNEECSMLFTGIKKSNKYSIGLLLTCTKCGEEVKKNKKYKYIF